MSDLLYDFSLFTVLDQFIFIVSEHHCLSNSDQWYSMVSRVDVQHLSLFGDKVAQLVRCPTCNQ